MTRPGSILVRRIAVLIFAALLLAGCAARESGPESVAEKYRVDYEEVVEEPYIPRDDGQPLTPAELRAFKTKGTLDARLSQEESQIVELHFKYFVHQHRKSLERFILRSSRYLPYIKQVFKEKGIPEEIAYLCMVESGGNPNAISPAGAAGLWQFMPFTGRKYGLTQNNWIDERRDPFKATHSAADYLLKLYSDFDDWHLAVAAYNAGEGKIGRGLAGTGAKDFFELCRLNDDLDGKARLKEETQQYVPRLLAMIKIMRNLKHLGFPEPSPADAYDLVPVSVQPGTSLTALAKNLGLSWEEFSAMNPAYRRTASPPTISSTAYLPPDKEASITAWLQTKEARVYADWKEHRVRKGESLSSLGKRYGVTIAAIREANGFKNLPKPGNIILIPGKGGSPVRPALASATGGGAGGVYQVAAGDTLFGLALRWGTSVDAICSANKMKAKSTLSVGQKLLVPSTSKTPPARQAKQDAGAGGLTGGGASYVVQPGDTLSSIARLCATSVDELCDANGLTKKSILKVGQSLRVPNKKGGKPAAPSSGQTTRTTQATQTTQSGQTGQTGQSTQKAPAPSSGKTITVRPGDTLYSLAVAHKTTVNALQKANGMGGGTALKPGQKLKLP